MRLPACWTWSDDNPDRNTVVIEGSDSLSEDSISKSRVCTVVKWFSNWISGDSSLIFLCSEGTIWRLRSRPWDCVMWGLVEVLDEEFNCNSWSLTSATVSATIWWICDRISWDENVELSFAILRVDDDNNDLRNNDIVPELTDDEVPWDISGETVRGEEARKLSAVVSNSSFSESSSSKTNVWGEIGPM